jgi:hypothetical protein
MGYLTREFKTEAARKADLIARCKVIRMKARKTAAKPKPKQTPKAAAHPGAVYLSGSK